MASLTGPVRGEANLLGALGDAISKSSQKKPNDEDTQHSSDDDEDIRQEEAELRRLEEEIRRMERAEALMKAGRAPEAGAGSAGPSTSAGRESSPPSSGKTSPKSNSPRSPRGHTRSNSTDASSQATVTTPFPATTTGTHGLAQTMRAGSPRGGAEAPASPKSRSSAMMDERLKRRSMTVLTDPTRQMALVNVHERFTLNDLKTERQKLLESIAKKEAEKKLKKSNEGGGSGKKKKKKKGGSKTDRPSKKGSKVTRKLSSLRKGRKHSKDEEAKTAEDAGENTPKGPDPSAETDKEAMFESYRKRIEHLNAEKIRVNKEWRDMNKLKLLNQKKEGGETTPKEEKEKKTPKEGKRKKSKKGKEDGNNDKAATPKDKKPKKSPRGSAAATTGEASPSSDSSSSSKSNKVREHNMRLLLEMKRRRDEKAKKEGAGESTPNNNKEAETKAEEAARAPESGESRSPRKQKSPRGSGGDKKPSERRETLHTLKRLQEKKEELAQQVKEERGQKETAQKDVVEIKKRVKIEADRIAELRTKMEKELKQFDEKLRKEEDQVWDGMETKFEQVTEDLVAIRERANERRRAEVKRLERHVRMLEAELSGSSLAKGGSGVDPELKRLQKELDDESKAHESEVEALKQKHAEQVKLLQREAEQLKKEVRATRDTVEKAKQGREESQREETERSKREMREVKRKLELKERECEELRKQFDTKAERGDMDELKTELSGMRKMYEEQIEELEQRLDKALDQKNRYKEAFEDEQELKKELETRLEKFEANAQQSQEKWTKEKTQLEEVLEKGGGKVYQQELQELQKKYNRLRERFRRTQGAGNLLEDDDHEGNALPSKDELSARGGSGENVDKLRAKVEELLKSSGELDTAKKSAEDRVQKLTTELQTVEVNLEASERVVKRLEREFDQAKHYLEDAEKHLADLTAENQRLKDQLKGK